MVPQSVAKHLKLGGQVEPQYLDSVTICYIDVANFLIIAAQLQAVLTVNSLTEISR